MEGGFTFNLKNLLKSTPRWASISLTAWSVIYGIYMLCTANELLHLTPLVEHQINGIYGIGNLVLLSFGGHKINNIAELVDNIQQPKSDDSEKEN